MIEQRSSDSADSFIDAPGEMALLIRQHNWSRTSLGPIQTWPRELKITVGIMLHSSFPMFLYWGEELVCLYNDAFRPSLGQEGKHPDILGKNGADAWPELWDTIFPLIRNFMDGKGSNELFEDRLLPIYRNGRIENVYWTFGYTPVHDELGQVAGVLVICHETTKTVNKFYNVVEHARTPIAIFSGEDLIVNEANQATLDLWRVDRSIIGKPFLDVVPAMRKQGFAELMRQVYQTGEKRYGYEAPIFFIREDGVQENFFFNFEFIPYREATGELSGVMVLATDVTELVRARNELALAEEETRMSIDAADLGSWNFDPSSRTIRCNDKTREIFNLPRLDNIDLALALKSIHPEDREKVMQSLDGSLQFGHPNILEVEYRVSDPRAPGEYRHIRTKGRTYFDENRIAQRVSGMIQDITESKKREQALSYRKAVLEAQNDAIPDGILIVDTKGRILSYNRSFERIWRMPPWILNASDDNAALSHAMSLMEDPEAFIKRVLFLYENQQDAAREEIRLKDGRVLERYGRSIRDDDGNSYGWTWYFRDITEQRNAEDALRRNEERYRGTFDNAAVGIGHVSMDGRWLSVNERLTEILGYTEEELEATTFQAITYPDDLAGDLAMVDRLLRGELPSFSMEKRYIHKSGRIVWVNLSVSLVYDSEGDPEYFISVVEDISQRIKAEEELRQVTAKQEETLALLESLLGNAPIGFAFFDRQYRYIRINQILADINGFPIEDHLGKPITELLPQLAEMVIPILETVGSTARPVLNIEVEGDPKAGSKGHRYWLTGFYPVINERTKLVDFVGAVVFEITDRKEAEKAVQTINERLENLVTERTRELQETNKELQRSNEDLQRFAHVASHDLKEPVRKIKMFSGRLKSEFASELPPKARGYIDKIESAVERMYNMIDGVLMYSSLNAMKQTVEKIDMNKIIQEIQMDLEIIVQQKKARILYDNLPSIYGSTLLVYQLFYNLIGNSLKFTKPGRNPVIRITCEEISDVSGSYFKIRIADNGIGFAQHDSERIFQTFSRLNPKDKFEGTGLGLTLCKNIVERHGGRIWAEGRDDEGATFVVELPVHP